MFRSENSLCECWSKQNFSDYNWHVHNVVVSFSIKGNTLKKAAESREETIRKILLWDCDQVNIWINLYADEEIQPQLSAIGSKRNILEKRRGKI